MQDTAIRVDRLGKRYRLGSRLRYRALRDVLSDAVRAPFHRLAGGGRSKVRRSNADEMWAIRDLSFEIKRGEVVGVIGRNGAGKTTLLRILSRITEPTEGWAEIHGRVGSLLEVGTGFHPELTGRENIYLNGAILGMRKAETARKFEQIVAFAETERFIDTPVKFYSSGMYVRLAFAVAAHLEPEILLVDEVLAVGDAAFQRKCLGKMEDVAKEGRTVLFVSHNLAAVQSLCTSGIVIEGGTLALKGTVHDAIKSYTDLLQNPTDLGATSGSGLSVRNYGISSGRKAVVESGHAMTFEFELNSRQPAKIREVLFLIRDSDQSLIVRDSLAHNVHPDCARPGRHLIRVELPPLWLKAGLYSYALKVSADMSGATCRFLSDPLTMQVVNPDVDGYELAGVLSPRVVWTVGEQVYETHASPS